MRPTTKPWTTTVTTEGPLTPPSPAAFLTTTNPDSERPAEPAADAAGRTSSTTVARGSTIRRMSATRVLRREGTPGDPANLPPMPASALQTRADRLAARIDGLAA